MDKKTRKIIFIAVILLVIVALGYWFSAEISRWWEQRKEYIEMGFASDKFPYRMYTEKELVEMGRWPVESQELMNTPTRIRPEETYVKFRQALIDEDLEKAAECFVKEKKEEWKKSLYEIKEKGFLQEMIDDLPKRLEDTYFYTDDVTGKETKSRDLDHTAMSSYIYVIKSDPERTAQTMTFVKNWDGDWLIEDL